MNAPEERGGRRPKRTVLPASETRYTQVNVLFPSGEIELPAADKINAFPPEAQAAILAAFKLEQAHRHEWLNHEHALNLQTQRQYFIWRLTGLCSGALMTMGTLGMGVWLVSRGAPATGVALIGTAVYGHQARITKAPAATKDNNSLQNG